MNRTRLIVGIALGLVISVGAQAAEKKIKQSDLPAAVQKSAELQSAGATVTGYTSDKVDGAMVYEMNLVTDGLTRSVSMDQDGAVVSVEQEITWAQVPADVKTDFTNVTGKGKLGAVSSITKQGKIVSYEAVIVNPKGEKSRVQVKPNPTTAALAPIPVADVKQ